MKVGMAGQDSTYESRDDDEKPVTIRDSDIEEVTTDPPITFADDAEDAEEKNPKDIQAADLKEVAEKKLAEETALFKSMKKDIGDKLEASKPKRKALKKTTRKEEKAAQEEKEVETKAPDFQSITLAPGESIHIDWANDHAEILESGVIDQTNVHGPSSEVVITELINMIADTVIKERVWNLIGDRETTPTKFILALLQMYGSDMRESEVRLDQHLEDVLEISTNPAIKTGLEKTECPECGSVFKPMRTGQICCSNFCGNVNQGHPINVNHPQCPPALREKLIKAAQLRRSMEEATT